jgi:Fe-coproporphyrin III synthase
VSVIENDISTIPQNQSGHHLSSLPILILNVHNRCNCRCVMCDIWKRETNVELKTASLERHRASMQNLGVRNVVLTGGEPLLHSDLPAFCNFFREEGIRLTLLTTGLLLQKRAETVAEFFDDVIVSLDGPEEVHDAVRRIQGAFRLIHDGITAIRSIRPEMPISGRSTLQRSNYALMRKTVAAAKELQLTSISFLAADVTSEAFNRTLVWPGERQSEIALTAKEVVILEDEIEQLILEYNEEIRSKYILEGPDKLRRLAKHFRAHLGQIPHQAPICNAPWVSTVVEVDGSVRPCFFHRTIGNLTSSTLEDVINGEEALHFRGSLDIAKDATCQRCVCSLNYAPS